MSIQFVSEFMLPNEKRKSPDYLRVIIFEGLFSKELGDISEKYGKILPDEVLFSSSCNKYVVTDINNLKELFNWADKYSSIENLEASLLSLLSGSGASHDVIRPSVRIMAEDIVHSMFRDLHNITRLPEKRYDGKRFIFTDEDGTEFPEYAEREDRSVNSEKFYRAHWKKYADAGLLDREELSELDPKLVVSFRSHCNNHDIPVDEALPKRRIDRITERSTLAALSEDDVIQAGGTFRTRQRRSASASNLGDHTPD